MPQSKSNADTKTIQSNIPTETHEIRKPPRRRARELLAQYYVGLNSRGDQQKINEYDIDGAHFNAEKYVKKLINEKRLVELIRLNKSMNEDIKNLDNSLQRLVYANYNKFITATETIKTMKQHVDGMEGEMQSLSASIDEITDCSNTINKNLAEKREKIEKLSRVNRMLKKLQFLLELPSRLTRCLEMKRYAEAVEYYNIASNILKQYSHLQSFEAIQKESSEIIAKLKKVVLEIVNKPSATFKELEEHMRLLVQLKEPEDTLRNDFLESRSKTLLALLNGIKMDPSADMRLNIQKLDKEFLPKFVEFNKLFNNIFVRHNKDQNMMESHMTAFSETTANLFTEYFKIVKKLIFDTYPRPILASSLVIVEGKEFQDSENDPHIKMLEIIRKVVNFVSQEIGLINGKVPQAKLIEKVMDLNYDVVSVFITENINQLRTNVETLMKKFLKPSYKAPKDADLNQIAIEFARQLYHDFYRIAQQFQLFIESANPMVLEKMGEAMELLNRQTNALFEFIIKTLHENSTTHTADTISEVDKPIKTSATGALIMCRLSVELAKTTLPKKISKLLIKLFSEKSVASLKLEDLVSKLDNLSKRLLIYYIEKQGETISKLIRAGMETPNWLNMSQPNQVRTMITVIVDEMQKIENEVSSLFPEGLTRSDSNSSHDSLASHSSRTKTSFSYSSRLSEKKEPLSFNYGGSNTITNEMLKIFNKNLAKFSIENPEFNKTYIIQEVLKISLKSLGECVRMCTFGKFGYQQLQVDLHYLRMAWESILEDENYVIRLLGEVISDAQQRCIEPVPLSQSIVVNICKSKKL